jgi:hypothetical protein
MDYEANPILNDARRAERLRGLGPDPFCGMCKDRRVFVLTTIRLGDVPLQWHHLFGRANDPDAEYPICFNCHAEMHWIGATVGASLARPHTRLHRIEAFLRWLGVLLQLLGERCLHWAQDLANLMELFDTKHKTWWRWAAAQ